MAIVKAGYERQNEGVLQSKQSRSTCISNAIHRLHRAIKALHIRSFGQCMGTTSPLWAPSASPYGVPFVPIMRIRLTAHRSCTAYA